VRTLRGEESERTRRKTRRKEEKIRIEGEKEREVEENTRG